MKDELQPQVEEETAVAEDETTPVEEEVKEEPDKAEEVGSIEEPTEEVQPADTEEDSKPEEKVEEEKEEKPDEGDTEKKEEEVKPEESESKPEDLEPVEEDDADQKALEGYKKNEADMADMFGKDPRSASFLKSWRQGENPVQQLVKQYGEDFLDYLSDPEHADEIADAQSEYLKRVSDGNKLQEQYDKNMAQSLDVIDKFEEEYGEEVANELVAKLMAVANDVVMGKVTKDALDMFRLASAHDEDVEDARHEGEVKGRNANITKNIRLKKRGDGTPNLDGKPTGAGRQKKPMPDLGALGRDKKNIWELGNEKRTRYN